MICPKCNKNNDNDSLFCEYCGKKLELKKIQEEKIQAIKEKDSKKEKLQKEKKIVEKPTKNKSKKILKQKKEKNNNKVLIFILIPSFLVVVIVILLLLKVQVPNVIGMTELKAISTLKSKKLLYEITYKEDPYGKNLVENQDIKPKTKVGIFKKVKIIILKEKDYSNANWSDWTETLPEEITEDNYKIEEKNMYASRDKELTTSKTNVLKGYTLYKTEYMNEYTNWSDWTLSKITANKNRKVENKTEYSSRTKTNSTYWGDWSSYSTTKQTADNIQKQERSRKLYKYFYFPCRNNYHSHDSAKCHNWACYWLNGTKICGDNKPPLSTNQTMIWVTNPYNYSGSSWQGTGTYIINLDNQIYFYRKAEQATKMEYSYRELKEKIVYGSWSNYTTTKIEQTENNEVRTRVYYRYQDKIKKYHFYRWSDWTELSDVKDNSTDNHEVKIVKMYRYTQK